MTSRRFYIPLATVAAAIGVALTVGSGWGQIQDNTARIERVELRTIAELRAINRKLDMLFSPRSRQ
jgi:hypothetical protein